MPPATMPPATMPPVAMPPATMPPATMPPATMPPATMLPAILHPAFARDLARAFALRARALRPLERAGRAELRAVQRRRLAQLLEHAARHAPYYRERWHGRVPAPEALGELEPTGKASLLVDGFDRALAVDDLTLAAAQRALSGGGGRLPRRGCRLGRYRVAATSGTSGEPAIVPFAPRDWWWGMAAILRSADLTVAGGPVGGGRGAADGARPTGNAPTLPATLARALRGRLRVAGISTLNPIHISSQMGESFHTGLVPSLRLPAGLPLAEQRERLQRFRPTVLGGYPSALDALAREAAAGALAIAPRLVFSGGETVSPALRRRVRAAWGVELFDFYGLTETLMIAGECPAHQGMHLYEDLAVVEVVDEAGGVLPAGERGAGVLVTSLINFTLPIIRYAVSDRMLLSDEPCPCGLPFRRILSVEGRSEELLELRRADGATVCVHPFVLEAPLEEIAGVRRFRILPAPGGAVRIELLPAAPAGEAAAAVAGAARAGVAAALRPLGVPAERLAVELVPAIERPRGATGKLLRGAAAEAGDRPGPAP